MTVSKHQLESIAPQTQYPISHLKNHLQIELYDRSCIKIARPNWREPITIIAIIKVSMLGQMEKKYIANAIVKKQWDTKNAPMKFDL